jgi:hypothetical protein
MSGGRATVTVYRTYGGLDCDVLAFEPTKAVTGFTRNDRHRVEANGH